MRILFDSRQAEFKTPFGTLLPGQECTLHIHIPSSCQTTAVEIILCAQNHTPIREFPMAFESSRGAYDIFAGKFSIPQPGLYFYYFRITTRNERFRLFKEGNSTNMEAGGLWQVSCIPGDFTTPDWAKGAIIYQIFPDRFHKSGSCDLTGKLEPYTVHKHWNEEVSWQPTPEGHVLNNDFFGGNLKGITEKMGYLASLGTTILYLNPISKSFSSHRYDTGDYKTIDPMLGTDEDFVAMCAEAHRHGIRVVLDGVYSHTGSDSLYFDKKGSFGGNGAYNSPDSPYYDWFQFHNYPDSYVCWWNFDTLPTVNKGVKSFINYIIDDEDSVVAHWLKLGADGFRLDVVDELPDEFVARLKQRIRQIRPDALLIGEVWEDASNKQAYGVPRRYFVDAELDSTMNYPFRTAIINFLRKRNDGSAFADTVMTILENYPPQVMPCVMNLLGTHDTPRILTAMVDDFEGSREEKAQRHLTRNQRDIATERLKMASFLQYMLPGSPSIYYGDEAGMEGYADPFNRRTYPWGSEDGELLSHYRWLGQIRKNIPALRLGDTHFFTAQDHRLGFTRTYEGKTYRIYVNRSEDDWEVPTSDPILYAHKLRTLAPNFVSIAPMGFCLMEEV